MVQDIVDGFRVAPDAATGGAAGKFALKLTGPVIDFIYIPERARW